MYRKKECVAMLLAGGQGSRLYTLTEKTAKPAVCFGGKYRIIDFTMSNCVNSGLDTVGVMTQYQPLVLNEYIGNGQPWDLDRNSGGVMTLPPYQGKNSAGWYKGTANAIYQNLNFIERYSPEYVLVLSGDHIYKMDYSKMLDFHKEKNADCTIAVLKVPIEQASRFGIMDIGDNDEIVKFEEKPAHPQSDNASMGIYIFNWSLLREYLIADEADAGSSNDFGKNIIPKMLSDKRRMFAYLFEGYWKDVGTISSLWEANMDLLGQKPKFDIYDRSWRVFYRHDADPPHRICSHAAISDSMICEGCVIDGSVTHSVLFNGVKVEEGAVIKDSVIMNNVVIKSGAVIEYSIIDHDAVIGNGAVCGKAMEDNAKITVIGADVRVPDGTAIPDGAMIDENNIGEISGKKED